ncbi:hypothetical protein GCM10027030_09400 [Luteococcus sediminum]
MIPHPVRRSWLVGGLLVLAVQLWGLYTPSPPDAGGLPVSDKLVHFLLFLGVTLSFALALGRRMVVALANLAHGVVSEVVQWRFVPGRSGDWQDFVADALGVGVAVVLTTLLLARRGTGNARKVTEQRHEAAEL